MNLILEEEKETADKDNNDSVLQVPMKASEADTAIDSSVESNQTHLYGVKKVQHCNIVAEGDN